MFDTLALQLILISCVDYTVPKKVSAALHQLSVSNSDEKPAPGGIVDNSKEGGVAMGTLCTRTRLNHAVAGQIQDFIQTSISWQP